MKKIEVCFNSFCYIATLSLLGFCLYIFCKNEDISEIIYRKYGENSVSLYPSFSFCIQLEEHHVNEEVFKNYKKEMNYSTYLSFLSGSGWNDKMNNVSYNKVTKPLMDHLVDASAFDSYDTDEKFGFKLENIHEVSFPMSHVNQMYRCMTFDLPNKGSKRLQFASIAIRQTIFKNQIRPSIGKFWVSIHQPNKFYRPLIAHKYNWPKRNKSKPSHYAMEFAMKSMEVLHRRDKTSSPCKYYKNYDNFFQGKLVEKVGCYPPYWNYDGTITKCRSMEKLKMFSKDILKAVVGTLDVSEMITQPCVELRKLMFDYEEFDTNYEEMSHLFPNINSTDGDSLIFITIVFLDPYIKEIKQARAFGIESLIGNIGGYMGLLLGVSIIQLPRFCSYWYQLILGSNKKQESTELNIREIEENI